MYSTVAHGRAQITLGVRSRTARGVQERLISKTRSNRARRRDRRASIKGSRARARRGGRAKWPRRTHLPSPSRTLYSSRHARHDGSGEASPSRHERARGTHGRKHRRDVDWRTARRRSFDQNGSVERRRAAHYLNSRRPDAARPPARSRPAKSKVHQLCDRHADQRPEGAHAYDHAHNHAARARCGAKRVSAAARWLLRRYRRQRQHGLGARRGGWQRRCCIR